MKKTFSLSMAWLHTWLGLYLGWLLFAVFLTGTMAVFEHSITHWMQPEALVKPAHAEVILARQLDIAQAYLEQHANREKGSNWMIAPISDNHPSLEVRWRVKGEAHEVLLNPLNGEVVSTRETEGGAMLTHFHYTLLAGLTGTLIVGMAAVVMLVGLISGIVIHKRFFKDFFTFRRRSSAQRSWLDAHNVAGVLILPFLFMITYTGLVMQPNTFLPLGIKAVYENPRALRGDAVQSFEQPYQAETAKMIKVSSLLPQAQAAIQSVGWLMIQNGGDAGAVVEFFQNLDRRISAVADHAAFSAVTGRMLGVQTEWRDSAYVYRGFVGIHMAMFGGWVMSWLYFLAGLVSCGLIATGLILFTIKRRKRPEHEFGAMSTRIYSLIEAINITAVMGSINAILIYFWANRVLPMEIPERSSWEVRAFLLTWLVSLLHALLRKPLYAWREQLVFAVLLCWLLPLCARLNGLPSLLEFWRHGDGIAFGVEATILLMGLLLATAIPKVSKAIHGVPSKRTAGSHKVAY
ncbi:PepSY domain-containing protein [Methylobacillus gramineus]|uniref:PepSY-associated TM helix domain-containing protein n=1 Tax=Methylobacillus gramineus TaxID=755169 RepID=UPI001CFFE98F|nr:PepSY-associated TM helix domain-containing protein [Methylobacillus gramineus]MCB5184065.1 PepSY domain-containing protein [Methylobacillus gramineus]